MPATAGRKYWWRRGFPSEATLSRQLSARQSTAAGWAIRCACRSSSDEAYPVHSSR
ncbi:hypothetical protein [Streptomyces sp. TLI_053]|uniref:hypothetical protein n=1 Tax=Streptomyces sp. TLI_053 TaxID=1855352 RepID=UPI0013520B34|nr:hypothetical protein [Streptomyces sp. TLI_053]